MAVKMRERLLETSLSLAKLKKEADHDGLFPKDVREWLVDLNKAIADLQDVMLRAFAQESDGGKTDGI